MDLMDSILHLSLKYSFYTIKKKKEKAREYLYFFFLSLKDKLKKGYSTENGTLIHRNQSESHMILNKIRRIGLQSCKALTT